MGFFKGRHAEVMSPRNLRQARATNDYPDLYIRSGELQLEVDDVHFDALMDLTTDLPEGERRQIEVEEGLRSRKS